MRGYAAAAAALCLALPALSGCSSTASPPVAPTTSRPSPSASAPEAQGVAGLRGRAVSALDCRTAAALPSIIEQTPISGELTRLVICPSNPAGKAITLDASTGSALNRLRLALSLPDQLLASTASPIACLAYADAPVIVLAETSTGRWQLYVPTDPCDHYLPAVRSAIAAAIP